MSWQPPNPTHPPAPPVPTANVTSVHDWSNYGYGYPAYQTQGTWPLVTTAAAAATSSPSATVTSATAAPSTQYPPPPPPRPAPSSYDSYYSNFVRPSEYQQQQQPQQQQQQQQRHHYQQQQQQQNVSYRTGQKRPHEAPASNRFEMQVGDLEQLQQQQQHPQQQRQQRHHYQQQQQQQQEDVSYRAGQKRPRETVESNRFEMQVGDLIHYARHQQQQRQHQQQQQQQYMGRLMARDAWLTRKEKRGQKMNKQQRMNNQSNPNLIPVNKMGKPNKPMKKGKNKKDKADKPSREERMMDKHRRQYVNRLLNRQKLSKAELKKERYLYKRDGGVKPTTSFQHPWIMAEGGSPTRNLTLNEWLHDDEVKQRIEEQRARFRYRAQPLLAYLTKGLISLSYHARLTNQGGKVLVTVVVGGLQMCSGESASGEEALSTANWLTLEKLFGRDSLWGVLKHTKFDPPLPVTCNPKHRILSAAIKRYVKWKLEEVPKLEGILLNDLKGREIMKEAMPCNGKPVVVSSPTLILETLIEVPRDEWSIVGSQHEGTFSLEIAKAGIMVEGHFGEDIDEDERHELLAHKALCELKGKDTTWDNCALELLNKLIDKNENELQAFVESYDEIQAQTKDRVYNKEDNVIKKKMEKNKLRKEIQKEMKKDSTDRVSEHTNLDAPLMATSKPRNTKGNSPHSAATNPQHRLFTALIKRYQTWKIEQVPKLENIPLSDLKGREIMKEAMPCNPMYDVVSSPTVMLETLMDVPKDEWSFGESEREGYHRLEIAKYGIVVEDQFGADVDEGERKELLAHKALCEFKGKDAIWRNCAMHLLNLLIRKNRGKRRALMETLDETPAKAKGKASKHTKWNPSFPGTYDTNWESPMQANFNYDWDPSVPATFNTDWDYETSYNSGWDHPGQASYGTSWDSPGQSTSATKWDPTLQNPRLTLMNAIIRRYQQWKVEQVPKLEGIPLSDLKGREIMKEAMPRNENKVVVSSPVLILETLIEVPKDKWSIVESENEGSCCLEIAKAGIMVEDCFGPDVDDDERKELLAHKALCEFKGEKATWYNCAYELLDKLIAKKKKDREALVQACREKRAREQECASNQEDDSIKMMPGRRRMQREMQEMEQEQWRQERKARRKLEKHPPAEFWADY